MGILNNNSCNIFLTYQFSSVAVNFLDLEVRCRDGLLSTCLYRKPTAVTGFLDYRSFHPKHTRDGVPTGQFLRARRNCTQDSDFKREAKDLSVKFKTRYYPKKCISRAYQRASGQSQDSLLVANRRIPDKYVRFITGYHTHWPEMSRILNDHWRILATDPLTSQVISTRPLITAKRAPNFKDLLTRSHYRRPTRRLNRGMILRGSFLCGDCSICPYMHPVRDSFCNPVDQKQHKLKAYINCKSSHVVKLRKSCDGECKAIFLPSTRHLWIFGRARRSAQLPHISYSIMVAAVPTRIVGLEQIRSSGRVCLQGKTLHFIPLAIALP
ncbi:unnamed protein product, partial [Ranitomeya imitator]